MIHPGASLRHHRMSPHFQGGVGYVKRKVRLTEEQEETRLRGLRILARMIVRAHLASLGEEACGEETDARRGVESRNGRLPGTVPETELLGRSGYHGT